MAAFIFHRVGSFFFLISSFLCRSRADSILAAFLKKKTNSLSLQVSQGCHSCFKHAAYWTKIISPPRNPLPGLTSSKYLGKTGMGRGELQYGRVCGAKPNNERKSPPSQKRQTICLPTRCLQAILR